MKAKLSEDERNLIVLGVRAGFDAEMATYLADVDLQDLADWLEQGAKDAKAKKETEAATFSVQYERAEADAAKTSVIAANVLREQVRTQPTAARTYLRELAAQRDLERARELTAST